MEKKEFTVDAKGRILGRVASEVALLLRGKNSPTYLPYVKPTNKVDIINASGLKVTGNKPKEKMYKRFSGYPSGLHLTSYERAFAKDPGYVLKKAISRMLPNNKLRRLMMNNLHIYNDVKEPTTK
jgi:large subunit ribosomal protein L13